MTQHAMHNLNSSTPTRLTPFGSHSGISITIQNISDVDTVYIGGLGLTTSSFGTSLSPAAGISIDLPNGHDAIYAIGDSGDAQVSILTVSLM